jgi:predicted SprT family Zn-dependent metalloprotease
MVITRDPTLHLHIHRAREQTGVQRAAHAPPFRKRLHELDGIRFRDFHQGKQKSALKQSPFKCKVDPFSRG